MSDPAEPDSSRALPCDPGGLPARVWLGVAALTLALHLVGLGQRDLWAPDEPLYAQISREMLRTGDWLVLRRNGKLWAEKPPLLFWSVTASARAWGGLDEWSARFPSAIAGVIACLALLGIARELGHPRAAPVAAVVLATTHQFAWQARYLMTEMLLVAGYLAACWAFLRADRTGQRRWLIPAALALAAATLAKGPLAWILFGLTLLGLKRTGAALGWPARVLAVAGAAGLVLPWYILNGLHAGQAALADNLLHHNLERFFIGFNHVHGPLFYLWILPLDALPWSLLWLPALLRWRDDPAIRRPAIVALLILLFFSCSASKIGKYLLPLLPWMALVVALSMVGERRGRVARLWALLHRLWVVALLAAAGLVVGLQQYWPPAPRWLALTTCAGLVVGAGVLRWMGPKRHWSWLAVTALTLAWGSFWLGPLVDPVKSARPFAARVRAVAEANPESRLVYWGTFDRAMYILYYVDRPFIECTGGDPLEAVTMPGDLVVCRDYDFEKLPEPIKERYQLLSSEPIGHKRFLLLRALADGDIAPVATPH